MSTTILGPPGSLGDLITFGPHANCTLDLCPIEYSVYKYRPSVPANATFVALFGVSIFVHVILGIRWRQWNFMALMILGSLVEIGGYAGRLILYNNPFSFGGFMDQIVLITTAPVFYTAGIYITLSKTSTGVDIAMTGLGLQVGGLFFFSVLFIDYLARYVRKKPESPLGTRMRVFFSFLGAAILLIWVRCVYRCYELSKGYVHSDLITNQGLFIGLEGVLVIIASFCLCVGHPGLIFGRNEAKAHSLPMFEEPDNSDSKV
ncbi:hypothetical protein ACHAPX_003745 [Trichoderma viride]